MTQFSPPALGRGDRVILRDERWRVLDLAPGADCAALRLAAAGETNIGQTRTFLLPFDRVRPLARRGAPRRVGRARWVRGLARVLADALPPGGLLSPASAAIDLLPYQLEPALALVRGHATRVLLAGDVGLGKTVQAGLVLHELGARGEGRRALVLVPAGLKDQWAAELRHRFGLAAVVADALWLAGAGVRLPRGVSPWSLPGVFVASIDLVKRPEVMADLEGLVWDLVIVDEAHAVAGATDRRIAADALCRRARYVVLATATPHAGDPAAFEALCTTGRLDPREPPVLLFQRTAAVVPGLARQRRRMRLLSVTPTPDERRMHRLLETYTRLVWRDAAGRADRDPLVAMIVLRKRALSGPFALLRSLVRRRAALAGEPPPAQLSLPFDPDDEHAAGTDDEEPVAVLSSRGLADAGRERALLDDLVEAARTAARAESKLAFLRRALRRTREPAIVFTEYRDTLLHLAEQLAPGERLALVHGGLPGPSRREQLDRFTGGEARLLLATDAAGEGLNLHARCRWVIHYELPWNPMRLAQRTGRVDRLGQPRPVHAWHLVAADTAEQLVLARLAVRLETIRAATGRRYALGTAAEHALAAAIVSGGPTPELPAASGSPPGSPAWRPPPPAQLSLPFDP
ncbi:MAG TPA: DEAD/DEAH box helicase, partial [Vicinamibacterales bacterium]|nr:DEAD/DEAH box helicase [Vicinamibacterales bacterium]